MEQEEAKWHALTREAAKRENDQKGSVTIVGSGIMSVGHFTLQSLGYMKTCDRLFYCVADPVTELYIKEVRPDAMDFYVLYDDDKERYKTYVQMSEILLHEARKGLHVVGIFYGHPGVFVLPSHRAIQIAKQEGMTTRMLAAPSAEDCLFADLGVDPSFPGCQTFEATDLLLRTRTICKDLHVIIWQVGCVGDTGFRFKGYVNDKLPVLVDYLQKVYGPKYELIHYIGPQYPICEPVKEKMKLTDICQPDHRKKITGISTFYLPPEEQRKTDVNMSKRLGLPKPPTHPVTRVIDRYTTRETTAIYEMASWTMPQNYQFSHRSPLSDHLRQLSIDPMASQPAVMSTVHRNALARKHPGQIRTLMKSRDPAVTTATFVATKIFTDAHFASEYLQLFKVETPTAEMFENATKWLAAHGFHTTAEDVQTNMKELLQSSLVPWTNDYPSNLGKTLSIDGVSDPTAPIVVWGNDIIKQARFEKGCLTWNTAAGNVSNAEVYCAMKHNPMNEDFDPKKVTMVHLHGSIWNSNEGKPARENFQVDMNLRAVVDISAFQGHYEIIVDKTEEHRIEICRTSEETSVKYDGKTIKDFTYDSCTLKWDSKNNNENAILYLLLNASMTSTIKGKVWTGLQPPSDNNTEGHIDATSFKAGTGNYRTNVKNNGKWSHGPEIGVEIAPTDTSIIVCEGGVRVNSREVKPNAVEWTKKDGTHTEIHFYRGTQNDAKSFVGYVWKSKDAKPKDYNFSGKEDKTGLTPWSGYYKTTEKDEQGKWVTGSEFVIAGSVDSSHNRVIINGKECQEVQFNNPVLSFIDPSDNKKIELTFYMAERVRKLFGYMWQRLDNKPDEENISGVVDHEYLLSWTGHYYTYINNGKGFKPNGPSLQIIGNVKRENSAVSVDDITVTKWQFNNPNMEMHWTDRNGQTITAQIQFFFPDSMSGKSVSGKSVKCPSFAGKIWKNSETEPSESNWIGDQNPPKPTIPHPGMTFWQRLNIAVTLGFSVQLVYSLGKWIMKTKRSYLLEDYRAVGGAAEDLQDVANDLPGEDPVPPPIQTTTETETTETDITTETTTDVTTDVTTDITTDVEIVVL